MTIPDISLLTNESTFSYPQGTSERIFRPRAAPLGKDGKADQVRPQAHAQHGAKGAKGEIQQTSTDLLQHNLIFVHINHLKFYSI